MARLVNERIRAVAEALKAISDDAIFTIEANDPQYSAIKQLVRQHNIQAIAIVVANAIISYRLTSSGEEYWTEFAAWFTHSTIPPSGKGIIEELTKFIESSRGNRLLIEQKKRRLQKIVPVLDKILTDPWRFRDIRTLYSELKTHLRSSGEKTLFFAAKMAYYVFRALGVKVGGLEAMEIPVDRRIALLTSSSLMVNALPEEIYVRHQRVAVMAWRRVSELSGKPPIHIDAVVWLPARGLEEMLRKGLLQSARDEYTRRLVEYSSGLINWANAQRLANEILVRNPFVPR